MRRTVYEILSGARTDHLARAINYGLLVLIGANVTASVLETDADVVRMAPHAFAQFERVSVAIFTAEYVLRLWSCTSDPAYSGAIRGRLRMALRPMSLVDLVAIAPFYVGLLVPGLADLRFLRVLRLFRVLRMLRIPRVAAAFSMLLRVIRAKRTELAVTLAFVLVSIVVSAGAIYVVERSEPGTQFTSIPRAMWWSMCTITTVGYGDMVPSTTVGHFIAGAVALVGICAVALPVGILSSGFVDEINQRQRESTTSGSCRACGRAFDEPHGHGVAMPAVGEAPHS